MGGPALPLRASPRSASRIADRVHVLKHGRVGRNGNSAWVAAGDCIRQAGLGAAQTRSTPPRNRLMVAVRSSMKP
jgi:hypothetical protein